MRATPFVDRQKIRPRSVHDYLSANGLSSAADFDRLRTACYRPAEATSYHSHSMSFDVPAGLDTVWRTYLSIPPSQTWRSRMIGFGCMYCKRNRRLSYLEDRYFGLREGQVLFLNIRLFWGMVNIAVAHQITRIEPEKNKITFSYIEGGKTQGSQELLFKPAGRSSTRIVHRTNYRGRTRSYLRERVLYPFLHGRVIASFHRNVRKKVVAGGG